MMLEGCGLVGRYLEFCGVSGGNEWEAATWQRIIPHGMN